MGHALTTDLALLVRHVGRRENDGDASEVAIAESQYEGEDDWPRLPRDDRGTSGRGTEHEQRDTQHSAERAEHEAST